jgi:hypothetical protein
MAGTGTFLHRTASKDRTGNTAEIRGHELDRPTDDLRHFDLRVEVVDGGATDVTLAGLTDFGWKDLASGVTTGDLTPILTPIHALRATWTAGSGGSLSVYATPKFNDIMS